MNQQEMDQTLARQKYLKEKGLLDNEVMGDYSTDIAGKRKTQGCFCGDCKHFKSGRVFENKEVVAYEISGDCSHTTCLSGKVMADIIRDCPHFKERRIWKKASLPNSLPR